MRLRLGALVERFRASLFFVPLIGVVLAIVLAALTLAIDSSLDRDAASLPLALGSTVQSARALLSTVAGATISFAGIAFSVSLLIIQQATSQYSPRVVHTLFRDPFNKRVMGLVVGTFTYCLVVLRSVRSPLDEGGSPVVPNISVAVAVVLGIITILAVVAFIDHSAHSMDVSRILENVQREAMEHLEREWTPSKPGGPPSTSFDERPPVAAIVRFSRTGWIQQLDVDELLRATPEGSTMWVEAYPGRYAIAGTPLCSLTVVPDDADRLRVRVCDAVAIGGTRTMQQDASFALRQLTDVALKALSPGINDPTTAQDAIFHLGAVLAAMLVRDAPPRVHDDGDRRVVLAQQPTHDELVHLSFDEIRRAAASQPAVCVYLLEVLELLHEVVANAGLSHRGVALADQARMVLDEAGSAELIESDLTMLETAFNRRFATQNT